MVCKACLHLNVVMNNGVGQCNKERDLYQAVGGLRLLLCHLRSQRHVRVVWTSLKGGRKNHTILRRRITRKDHEMFPQGGEAKLWSQELESVVATCVFGIAQTY